jgi:hypothetical protein
MYDQKVVATINALNLPRYGLQTYLTEKPTIRANEKEKKGEEVLLSDYILKCPMCDGDSISNCSSQPYRDVNESQKEAVKENSMRKGGRIVRRQRKSRKTRKNNRRTRNKKARKSKLTRKR